MTNEIASFKRKFNKSLEPYKVMLVNQKKEMNQREWRVHVEKIKESVIGHPDQYLGQVLPQPKVIRIIVQEIFDEFIKQVF